MKITVTGLNHKRAPVELRERLAIKESDLAAELEAARRTLGADEAVILSTCNRVEVYTVHDQDAPGADEVMRALAERHRVSAETLKPVLYRHEGMEAVRHLFRVTASLDSMVLGETQIVGQVRDAYLAAKESSSTGRVFNRLFQKAMYVSKRIRTCTSIGDKNVSIPSVASRLAEKIFQDMSTRKLVIIGAGEMGELTVTAFRNRGVKEFHVVNRTEQNAATLAERFGGRAHPLTELERILPLGDVIITCIASDRPILTPGDLRASLAKREFEPVFLIDIAVPRNVHPEVNSIDNVYLYNVDDLQAIVDQNLIEREQAVSRCIPLIDEETEAFFRDVTPPDAGALVAALRDKLQAIGSEEADRTISRLEGLTDTQKQEIAEGFRRSINKILHTPTEALRGGALDGKPHTILELARKLFGINK